MNVRTIKARMKSNLESCRDARTGELNHTLLAETTCADLDAFDGDDIPEQFFELAINFE